MDWTSIYEEHGNEELLLPPPESLIHPRLARLVSVAYHLGLHGQESQLDASRLNEESISSSYTLSALYFLTINYILGVGCLGIPYAFAKSGILLGLGLVVIVSILSYMTVMWLAETGIRYEMLCNAELHADNTVRTKTSKETSKHHNYLESLEFTKSNLVDEQSLLIPCKKKAIRTSTSNDAVFTPDYEVINLVDYFLGRYHKHLYQASLMALMYIGLLAYSQVFVGSMSSFFHYKDVSYIATCIFSLIVLPLSCMELDEQVSMQFIMSLVRFLAIFIMVFGCLIGLIYRDRMPSNDMGKEEDNSFSNKWLNMDGFGVAFSTALFSQLFQHSVPGLVRPLQEEKKVKVPITFALCLITTCSLYIILGITASLYFENNTLPSVNLNFDMLPTDRSIFLLCATKLVVVFPALDTLSVFPLIANTLGSNLLAVCGSSATHFITAFTQFLLSLQQKVVNLIPLSSSSSLQKKNDAKKFITQRVIIVIFRLLASIPPLLLSLYITDLSMSMQFAGVAGLYVAFFAPALLYRKSYIDFVTKYGKENIVYTGWYSNVIYTLPVLLFAMFALVIVLYHLILVVNK